jgi:hypothetical protein
MQLSAIPARKLLRFYYPIVKRFFSQRLADELKAQGCEVYFDRERLGAGINFDLQLED